MTQEFSIHEPSKKRRGRPKGTAPFKAKDEALLRTVARDLAAEPGLNLTTLLRELCVSSEKDLARLRRRWRLAGDCYLRDAKRDLNAAQKLTSLFVVADSREAFDGQFISTEYASAFTKLVAEYLKKKDDGHGLTAIHKGARFCTASGDTSRTHSDEDGAIDRFERRDRRIDACIFKTATTDVEALSVGDRAYVFAVLFHERALALWAAEKGEAGVHDVED